MYFHLDQMKAENKPFPASITLSVRDINAGVVLRITGKMWVLEIPVPFRPIYVMSGDSRYKFKHGIRQASKNYKDKCPISAWNFTGDLAGMRMSMTYRSLKEFADLQLKFRGETDRLRKSRLIYGGKYVKEGMMEAVGGIAAFEIYLVEEATQFTGLRFTAVEAPEVYRREAPATFSEAAA